MPHPTEPTPHPSRDPEGAPQAAAHGSTAGLGHAAIGLADIDGALTLAR